MLLSVIMIQLFMGNLFSICQARAPEDDINDRYSSFASQEEKISFRENQTISQHLSKIDGQLLAIKLRVDILEKRNRFKDLLQDTTLTSFRLPTSTGFSLPFENDASEFEPPDATEMAEPPNAMDHPLSHSMELTDKS